jgi:hypothetical protein
VFLGIYDHPPPDVVAGVIHGHEVAPTWTNKVLEFASAYAAKSALWLAKLPKP